MTDNMINEYQPPARFSAAFEGFSHNPDDLDFWPNSVRVDAVEGYDPTLTATDVEAELEYADRAESRQLVEVDTNYKPTRDSDHPVRLTRVDAVEFATAVIRATEDTFHWMRCGRLRPVEARDLLAAVTNAEYALAELRDHALEDLLRGTGLADDPADAVGDAEAGDDGDQESGHVPVSKPIPALAAQPEAEASEPEADAGELEWTLEQAFADALGGMFPRELHEIASSDAYGALKYKVCQRCQETGETPAQVLAAVSPSDRVFVARANDPAAFLASRIDS
ncbi:hypothetical protein [Amycolatopsis sp. NPDC050768]|uniref:hypothetical protein n=1 Tax=Amycolatopsis sp. NPDC050768 TaxID=3154839 RepID=UPI0033E92636